MIFTALCKSERLEVVKEVKFHPKRMWRFDYCFPSLWIALEVEGGAWSNGRHTRGKGFLGDMDKYNEASRLGWIVLRTTPSKLLTMETIKLIKETAKAHGKS